MSNTLNNLVAKYPELDVCVKSIEDSVHILTESFRSDGKLLICGNGGSASDSEHIVGELMKGFMSKRPLPQDEREKLISLFPGEGELIADHLQGALPAISLVSHTSLITAFVNDVAAELIYAQQVNGYGRPGDVLLGISTSGNSLNVLRAVQVAKAKGLKTILLTGKTGGKMKELCDVSICVPWDITPDVQERHLPIYHAICIILEERFFPAK